MTDLADEKEIRLVEQRGLEEVAVFLDKVVVNSCASTGELIISQNSLLCRNHMISHDELPDEMY